MDEFGSSSKQQDATSYTYLFDMMDAVCLLSMCNKETLVRQLAFVLLSESGKLKRLLMVPSEKSLSLSDMLINKGEELRASIIESLLVYTPLKQQSLEIYSKEGFESLLKQAPIEQLLVDNFDYKQAGLSDSIVKDLNVLIIGNITQMWL